MDFRQQRLRAVSAAGVLAVFFGALMPAPPAFAEEAPVVVYTDYGTYAASCDRQAIALVAQEIAEEGDKQARHKRGVAHQRAALGTLLAAKWLYEEAQSVCGYNFASIIEQLDAAGLQAFSNMLELEVNGPRRALGALTALINGFAAGASIATMNNNGTVNADECPPIPQAGHITYVCR
jgi:hypothetical protein